MNIVLKRRLIGAAVLVAAGVLIPIALVKLAQPSAPPHGESVRVYEITPAGKARPVDAQATAQNTPRGAVQPPSGQSSSANTSRADTAPIEHKFEQTQAPKPEVVAPQARSKPAQSEASAKPEAKTTSRQKPKPKPKPAPAPKPTVTPKSAPQASAQVSKGPPATADKPYYVVQIGSFGDEKNALGLVQKLQRDFPVFYRQGEVGGNPVYRVRVGPYDSREAAEVMATRLRERGLKTQTMSLP